MIPTNKKTKKTNNKVSGGNALTSGGFGCFFKPALKCKNMNINYNPNLVTKLMTKKHALDEFKQIQMFKSILEHIPNYQNYFLVDGFSKCEPSELTNDDLIDFDENCKALKKKNFTAKNINHNLNKILALNMPDGGIDVDDYIDSFKDKSGLAALYMNLNTSLVNLLVNGIDPMNKSQLYHCDVKGSNILVSLDNEKKTRLIDWGLSVYRKDDNKTHIPDKLNRRPFQFNVPFSVILFNKKFIEKYNLFLKRHKSVDFFAIREFVINYIFYWNKIRGAGHLKTINSIYWDSDLSNLVSIH
jgi:serine/threonine protein kinase